MQDILKVFGGITDPRRGNASRHDLHEIPMIALPSIVPGGETCTDMADCGRIKEDFLRRFMTPSTAFRVTMPSPTISTGSIRTKRAVFSCGSTGAGRSGWRTSVRTTMTSWLVLDIQDSTVRFVFDD